MIKLEEIQNEITEKGCEYGILGDKGVNCQSLKKLCEYLPEGISQNEILKYLSNTTYCPINPKNGLVRQTVFLDRKLNFSPEEGWISVK